MPIVVDAYNVLHVTGVLSPDLAGGDLAELAALIATSRYRRETALLACDGVATAAAAKVREPSVRVAFAGGGRTADDYIATFVQASSAPRSLTVVSSDRAVLKSARRRGCATLTGERFLAQLEADRRSFRGERDGGKPVAEGMPRETLEEWMATFGLDEGMRKIPASRPGPGSRGSRSEPPPEPARAPAASPTPIPAPAPTSPPLPPDVARILEGLDLDRLLAGTPPPREEERPPRPTRASRDRARKRRGRRRDGE
jgi:predicted RNA-binding protein with PIN domain